MYQPPGQRADLRQLTRIRVAIAALQLLVVWAASLWVELRVWTLTGLITLGLLSSGLLLVGGLEEEADRLQEAADRSEAMPARRLGARPPCHP